MIENYHIKVAEEDIQLLKDKIKLTRWPDEINHRWSHGTDLNCLLYTSPSPRDPE